MKIYTINGRKVWLNEAPKGYEEPKKAEPKKAEPEKVEKPKAEPKTETKARTTANKSRKAGANK